MIEARKVIEAILFLADEAVPAARLGEVLEEPTAEVRRQLEALAAAYEQEDRGFVLREVVGGWRLYTSPDCAPWLERFVTSNRHARLTSAALEVLAIVAYRQPISRTQISEIRGVDSEGVVGTLMQRGLIEASGHDDGRGNAVLFRVADAFLEQLGLRSVEELPPLSDFMPDAGSVEDMESKLSPGV